MDFPRLIPFQHKHQKVLFCSELLLVLDSWNSWKFKTKCPNAERKPEEIKDTNQTKVSYLRF
jgi:hypothetical protein